MRCGVTALLQDDIATGPPRKKLKVFVEIVQRRDVRSNTPSGSNSLAFRQSDGGDAENSFPHPTTTSEYPVMEVDSQSTSVRDKGKQKATPTMKFGPPRGAKRKRTEIMRERLHADPKPAADTAFQYQGATSNAFGSPGTHPPDEDRSPERRLFSLTEISSQTRRLLRREEEENTQEALNVAPGAGGIPSTPEEIIDPLVSVVHPHSRKEDTFSREGIVPETQPPEGRNAELSLWNNEGMDDTSINVDLPTTPVRSPALRSRRSESSLVSQMKRRSHSAGGRTAVKVSPLDEDFTALSHPDDESSKPRKGNRHMRPLPTLSPSVFRPHLPEPDLPSSIEQFSSPERGSHRAAGTLIQKAKQRIGAKSNGRPVTSTTDDEILRARGQALATEATSARTKDRRRQFQPRRALPLFQLEKQRDDRLLGQVTIPSDSGVSQKQLDVVPDEHLIAQQMVEEYIDFEGGMGQPEERAADQVHVEDDIIVQSNAPDPTGMSAPSLTEASEVRRVQRMRSST